MLNIGNYLLHFTVPIYVQFATLQCSGDCIRSHSFWGIKRGMHNCYEAESGGGGLAHFEVLNAYAPACDKAYYFLYLGTSAKFTSKFKKKYTLINFLSTLDSCW